MSIRNFINILDRTYQQNVANIKSRLSKYVPEITNHTDSEILIRVLKIWYGLIEMLGYNLDVAIRELFIGRVRLYKNAIKIADSYDYRVRGYSPAGVTLRFYTDVPTTSLIYMASGVVVQTDDGTKFITTEELSIDVGEQEAYVSALQQEQVSGLNIGTATSSANQVHVIDVSHGIVDNSVEVVMDGTDPWEITETFAHNISTDEVYRFSYNENGKGQVQFGDDLTGAIPTAGESVEIDYKKTLGSEGNVAEDTITNIVTTITTPSGVNLFVTNPEAANGGSDYEGIEDLKRNVPRYLRTVNRAVTEQDYNDIASLTLGVAQAGTVYKCGKTVEVYVAPVGGGIASSDLLAAAQDYIDERKMITTNVVVKAAGVVELIITASVRIGSSYINASKKSEIDQALVDYYSANQQKVGGTVHLSDVYQVIENIVGVQNSDVTKLTTIPYARVLEGSNDLTWSVETLSTSHTTIRWKVVFTSTSAYQLFRGNDYVGTHNAGDTVTKDEVEFTITGTYTIGDTFEFYTYNYFGNVSLSEMSLPLVYSSNLNISVTGGV